MKSEDNENKGVNLGWLNRDIDYHKSKLKYVANVIDPHPSHRAPELVQNSDFYYLGIQDIDKSGNIDPGNARPISEDAVIDHENRYGGLQHNDIVFCKVGTIGEPRMLKNPQRSALSATLLLIRPEDQIDPLFLYYALDSIYIENQINVLSSGSTRDSLGTEDVRSLRVPIPPRDIQERVAKYIHYEVSQIKDVTDKKEALINKLEEKKEAAVERFVTEGAKDTQLEKDSQLEVLGKCPVDWEVRRAKTLFRQRDDRGYTDLPLFEVSLNHGVRPREENKERNAWEASDLRDMKKVCENDLVFNKMRLWQGAIGRAEKAGLVSPDYIVLEPRTETHSLYYELLLRTEAYKTEVNRRSYGVVDDRNRIYWKQFGDMPLLHPPFSQQKEIVSQVKYLKDENNKSIDVTQDLINTLEEKRQALLTKAVTGQIDLTEWKPPDGQEVSL